MRYAKDVTAMANAEGGYIVIGVHEEDKIAHSFFNVPDAEREAKSIYDTCHQYIAPRIAKLEIETIQLKMEGTRIQPYSHTYTF